MTIEFIRLGLPKMNSDKLKRQIKSQVQNRFAKPTQQSVHWTLGILPPSQAVFYTSALFCSDGFAPSAPAPVTQTVRQHEPASLGIARLS
jgi:hypothetical protein